MIQVHHAEGVVDKRGRLRVDVPTTLEPGPVEVALVYSVEDAHARERQYDFSDLAGRLKWSGDAVEAQRRIRDEWDALSA
jgi:hypothetical protein